MTRSGVKPRISGLSVDVDSVSCHLQGYGIDGGEDDGAAYHVAIPRALTLFERHGCRATFFLVAQDALRHPDTVRDIVARGHEVASHSMTHELPLTGRGPEGLELEVAESKRALESIIEGPVSGFRAPSWDAPPPVLDAVAESGYTYDASAFPSLLLPLLRMSVARRSEDGQSLATSGFFDGVWGPTAPYLREANGRVLAEVPICTAPWTRFPHYHTLAFLLPRPVFAALTRMVLTRRGPTSYVFHAVDFLGVDEDGLDPRIRRHPGMEKGLEEKAALAEDVLERLARHRTVSTLRQVVRSEFGC